MVVPGILALLALLLVLAPLASLAQDKPQTRGKIYAAVLKYVQDKGWKFSENPGKATISLGFKGDNGSFDCLASAREAQEQLVFYSICPLKVPADKRAAMGEFIVRVNDNLIVGNLDMHWDSGTVTYRTSIDVEGDRLTPALIKHVIGLNILTIDKYLPGITAVLNNIPPADAVAKIRGKK
jgi:hypothetical protein